MKRPLVCLTVIFCLGIVFAKLTKIPFLLLYSFALIFLIYAFFSARKELRCDIFLCCLAFLSGAVLLRNSECLPKCHISEYTFYKDNSLYTVKGFIANEPVSKENKSSFILEAKEIGCGFLRYRCCGKLLVGLRRIVSLRYGDEFILSGNLSRPYSSRYGAKSGYRNYLYNQGIYTLMQVKAAVKTNKNKGFILKRLAIWLKEKMESIIFKRVANLSAGVLAAMILGERRDVPALINDSMIKTGTVHILVVSGFNVGIVAFIIILFLKLTRLPRKARLAIAIFCLIIYCLLTGSSTPVVRATVMSIIFILGLLLEREADIYNALSLAAIFILLANPRQLFDVGFQLSFVSVISIVYLYPKIKSRFELKIKYLRFLFDGLLVSFSAWLGTMGFIAYYFKIFSPVTIFANIFIVPLATLITLAGFSLIFTDLFFPVLSPYFALTAQTLVLALLKLNIFLVKLPAAYFYLP